MKYYEGPEELKDVIESYIVIGDYLKIFYLNGESIEKYDKEKGTAFHRTARRTTR